MKVIVFRDLKDDGHEGYQYLGDFQDPDTRVVAQGTIPGAFGMREIHIQHLQHPDFLLVTQAYERLSGTRQAEIIQGAKEFLAQQFN